MKSFSIVVVLLAIGAAHAANHPDCGTKGPARAIRIVGGSNATPNEFPWQISLRRYNAIVGWYHTCGGSILNENWILTAAHCVDSTNDVSQFRVRVGDHDSQVIESIEREIDVDKMFKHPQWDSAAINNDVAVLKLKTPLNFATTDSALNPVCLPDKEDLDKVVPTPCVATGWGNTQWQGSSPRILQKVTVSVWKAQDCVTRYAGIHPITDGMICFGENGKGTCQGDSGGPLNCKLGDRWYSYGATSFGVQCAGPTYPSASARNSEYSSWIWTTIAAN